MVELAIILAGGKGERLRPLTNDRPKPMIEVADKPILHHQIEWLKKAGVKEVIFACSYKSEVIKDYFKDGKKFGLEINYSVENTALGSAGAIKQALGFASRKGDYFALNGDNLINLDWQGFIKKHQKNKAEATMIVTPLRSPYGIVDFNKKSQVLGFREKPVLDQWINAGLYIFSDKIAEYLPDEGSLEFEVFPKLDNNKFYVFEHKGYWRGIDTIKDLTEAEKEFKAMLASESLLVFSLG